MKNPSANLTQSDSKAKASQPKHLSSNRKGLLGKVLVVGLVLASLTAVPQLENRANDARANGSSEKVVVYLSAPQVMGSGVTEAVQRATFDDLTVIPVTGAPPSYSFCPNDLDGIGPITFRESPTITAQNSRILPPGDYLDGICAVDDPGAYGGASTDTSVRTFGGTATRYMKVPFYSAGKNERSITFELASDAKYVGFWWSGGNAGNLVRFIDANDNLVAEIDSADIQQILGGANTATPTGDVLSRGGTAYSKSSYRGNPVYYSDLDTKPITGDGTNGNPFIYTYLNLFVEGSLGIRKVQFAGPGFEFDNLAFSTDDQTPDDTMVLVIERNSPALTWTPVRNLALSASPATPSQLATKSGDGTISYSVKNPGTTGCTVNSTTGVITYTAVGDCVVTATVTGTNTYLKSTKDVTFTITSESNENGGGGNYTPVAETKLNPCQAISGVENVTRKAKSFSGFAINSAVLTKAMKKEIRSFLRKHPKEVCVSVAGFTMGPRVLSTDAKLAKDRAKAVRTYIKSLRPDAAFTKIKWSTEKRVGNNVRRAKVTLRF